jgi:hypothetical protein
MKYLLCTILLAIAIGVAAPPLYYTHALPITPALIMAGCIGFACYLFDSTQFLAFSADVRKSLTCWFKKGETP